MQARYIKTDALGRLLFVTMNSVELIVNILLGRKKNNTIIT